MSDINQAGVLKIWKQEGETPLEALNRLRAENELLSDETLSYAGRLDPMAEGVMLVLVGKDANRKREEYLNLDKEYEVEILFGVETDTYDVLGLVNKVSKNVDDLLIPEDYVGKYERSFIQPYPPFSSKPVDGKPLFQWVREGKLHEIKIPTKKVKISKVENIGQSFLSGEQILKSVSNRIAHIQGDFRQTEILDSWNYALRDKQHEDFLVLSIRVKCSSGTYMRSLAHTFGHDLGCGALAFKITRTKVEGF